MPSRLKAISCRRGEARLLRFPSSLEAEQEETTPLCC